MVTKRRFGPVVLGVGALHLAVLGALATCATAPALQPSAQTVPPTISGRLVAPAMPSRPPAVARPAAGTVARGAADARTATARPPHPVHATPAATARTAAAPPPAATAIPAPASPPDASPGAPPPVTPPLSDASGQDNPLPVYPAMSRRLGEEGTVILDVLILADGRVGDIAVKHSSGVPRLDAAALAAVRRWHYRPARRGGQPVDYRYSQPVTFRLDD